MGVGMARSARLANLFALAELVLLHLAGRGVGQRSELEVRLEELGRVQGEEGDPVSVLDPDPLERERKPFWRVPGARPT
jgi:hypothetical protein